MMTYQQIIDDLAMRREILDLAKRIEQATPSRELDCEIYMKAVALPGTKFVHRYGEWWIEGLSEYPARVSYYALEWTSSLDAVVALIPKGWSLRLDDNHLFFGTGKYEIYAGLQRLGPHHALLAGTDGTSSHDRILALCAAALRAIIIERDRRD